MRRALPLMAGLAVAGLGALAWPYSVDDAYVLARYAERLAGGLGYTMNEGSPTDGVTGPLGLLPALVGARILGDALLGSKLFGLLSGAGAAVVAVRAAEGSRHRGMTALLVVTGGSLPIWSVAGLETGLAALAFTVMGVAALGSSAEGSSAEGSSAEGSSAGEETPTEQAATEDRAGRARGVAIGLGIAALAWLRPEAAPAALVALLTLRAGRAGRGLAWGLALAGLVSVVAFRLALFGAPLPLSSAAKPPELEHGLSYLGRGLFLGLGGVGAVGLALAACSARWRSGALIVLAHLVAVALAGGDWMPGLRLLAPMVPLYALVAGGAFAERSRRGGWTLAVGAAIVPALGLGLALGELPAVEVSRAGPGAALARRLAELGGPVAMVDVGFLARASGVEVVDLGGITDPGIGRLPGGHVAKEVDAGLLARRDPRAIVLHSTRPPRVEGGRLVAFSGHPVEHRVARMPWVRRYFEVERVVRYAPGYHYVLLAKRREPLPRASGLWQSRRHGRHARAGVPRGRAVAARSELRARGGGARGARRGRLARLRDQPPRAGELRPGR